MAHAGRELDLRRLWDLVSALGGWEGASNGRQWGRLAVQLGADLSRVTNGACWGVVAEATWGAWACAARGLCWGLRVGEQQSQPCNRMPAMFLGLTRLLLLLLSLSRRPPCPGAHLVKHWYQRFLLPYERAAAPGRSGGGGGSADADSPPKEGPEITSPPKEEEEEEEGGPAEDPMLVDGVPAGP